jgi:hypothetical protein
MDKTYFQALSKHERIQMLRDNAEKTERFDYMRDFDDDELANKKDEFAQKNIELRKIEDEFQLVKDDFKTKMKPVKEECYSLLDQIRNKGQFVTEDVYLLANQEDGLMEYYNSDGQVVHTRKLNKDEKQMRVSFNKAVNE